jgi:hypothetical protein
MLADDSERSDHAGALDAHLYFPAEWLSSLIGFLGTTLVSWRDDPRRPAEVGETRLTAQLCSHLNCACRHSGWDYLQFKREEPDETNANRAIDLAVAPRSSLIWLEGREHSEYQTLLPIECKRLPTPTGRDRDEREYLVSRFNTTGGVDRFKRGHHGALHLRAAMIGYVQDRGILHWHGQVGDWIDELVAGGAEGWSNDDELRLVLHDALRRSAHLHSRHPRIANLDAITIDHLWIEL